VSRIKDIRKSIDIKHMYVRLYLHKATINATVMDENKTELNEVKIKSANSLRNFSDSIPFGSDIAIALKHGTGKDIVRKAQCYLIKPTKAIAELKVKTDKVDSLTLANLLKGGYIA